MSKSEKAIEYDIARLVTEIHLNLVNADQNLRLRQIHKKDNDAVTGYWKGIHDILYDVLNLFYNDSDAIYELMLDNDDWNEVGYKMGFIDEVDEYGM